MEKRVPLYAALAFFLTPGLGQLYNGKPKKAIAIYGLSMLLLIVVFFAYRHLGFAGFIAGNLLALGFALYAIYDGYREAKALSPISLTRYNRFYVYILIILLNSLVVVPLAVARNPIKAFKVPSGSMQPTIMVGDRIMANMRHDSEIHRGDVVVLAFPKNKKLLFFKRIMGLPGETVEIRGKQIIINGKSIDDPWGFYEYQEENRHVSCALMAIPDNQYFALGDNRDNSMDSRQWGCVDKAAIYGRPLFIYWSRHMRRIGKGIV